MSHFPRQPLVNLAFTVFIFFCLPGSAKICAQTAGDPVSAPRRLDIFEYRIEGVQRLTPLEVETVLYPFLGEARTAGDVEGARAALEKAYQTKGYQTVVVEVPPQQVTDGAVYLRVIEGKVGRLRVRGSRYYDLNRIKENAPSMAEGEVPDFNAVTRDIVALNQSPDRRVTPALRAGVVPGTVDIDLNVEDKFPLHGNVELNNRHSADTKPLRLNGSITYNNLWQLEHSVGLNFQIAPQRLDDAEVISAWYLARLSDSPVSLLFQGVKQDSNVSTLGAFDVAGRGDIVGLQAIIALGGSESFAHSLSIGIDYKHYDQTLTVTGNPDDIATPITYWPLGLNYSLTRFGKNATTQLNAGLNFHLRGMGSGPEEFDARRSGADGSYIYFRGDLSQTRELGGDWQLYGTVMGQLSSQPLVSGEQFGAGGLGTVRGYLESEALGDNGIAFSAELRTPPLTLGKRLDEWRFYVFAEWAGLTLNDPLPDQDSRFQLASIGAGTRLKFRQHYNGSLDFGLPLLSEGRTDRYEPRLTFRIWAEF
ncbi:ShlB/FhaC/HecB family hemolysin secretion/activation protein [Opitutaceae bacterium TAV4]|nr:ShlB/FhaC/HecB family hemolysin secretion/activation protein [Opitutaceae bacterium TAV4]RRK00929.1 ShlB/FhaC/HecB family hemolysin secretion/activation protein [Opitutaceae bacterium TAV3]